MPPGTDLERERCPNRACGRRLAVQPDAAADQLFAEYAQREGAKPCPTCHAMVSKVDGELGGGRAG